VIGNRREVIGNQRRAIANRHLALYSWDGAIGAWHVNRTMAAGCLLSMFAWRIANSAKSVW
jgi:hypothetical protein